VADIDTIVAAEKHAQGKEGIEGLMLLATSLQVRLFTPFRHKPAFSPVNINQRTSLSHLSPTRPHDTWIYCLLVLGPAYLPTQLEPSPSA